MTVPNVYSDNSREMLQEMLNTIAASKSPTARERNVIAACVFNARTARNLLLWSATISTELDEVQEFALKVDATYREYEDAIRLIEDANRRAIRR